MLCDSAPWTLVASRATAAAMNCAARCMICFRMMFSTRPICQMPVDYDLSLHMMRRFDVSVTASFDKLYGGERNGFACHE